DDDVAAARLRQHGRGDLAGEGPFLAPGDVLSGDLDLAALGRFGRRRNRGEGRRDHDVRVSAIGDLRQKRGEKGAGLAERLVHLPVSGNDRTASHLSVSAVTPGSSRPPRNSREAPPPVEMCEILSANPAWCTAATESPPPTIDVAPAIVWAATALAIS